MKRRNVTLITKRIVSCIHVLVLWPKYFYFSNLEIPSPFSLFRISLYRNGERIPPTELTIVQEYLDKPFLLEGYKFDLRVYVLITSCDPLRIFLFNDGLVRMSTEKYCNPNDSNVVRKNYILLQETPHLQYLQYTFKNRMCKQLCCTKRNRQH